MLVAAENHIWRDRALVEGEPHPAGKEASKAERERLKRIGLAKEVEREPKNDIPEDLPGRPFFLQADITSFDAIKQMLRDGDIQDVEQVGPSTEQKLKNYFD